MEIAGKVFSVGNSHAIRVPMPVMEMLHLRAEDPIILEVRGEDELVIRKMTDGTKEYPSISELFAGYSQEGKLPEMDGGTVGRELL